MHDPERRQRRPWADPHWRLPAQLGQLGADKRRLERPDERDRVALAGEPHPPGAGCSGSSPTIPTTGVGKIGPLGASL